jgi:hypothetical protein
MHADVVMKVSANLISVIPYSRYEQQSRTLYGAEAHNNMFRGKRKYVPGEAGGLYLSNSISRRVAAL